MDRRDVATALGASLPIILTIVLERIVGPPLDAFMAWPPAPVVLLAVALAVPAVLLPLGRRYFGPTRDEVQQALDKMIDRIYVLPLADRPPEGITTEGVVMEHAPANFRRDQYVKLGLPEPKPHKSQYR